MRLLPVDPDRFFAVLEHLPGNAVLVPYWLYGRFAKEIPGPMFSDPATFSADGKINLSPWRPIARATPTGVRNWQIKAEMYLRNDQAAILEKTGPRAGDWRFVENRRLYGEGIPK